MYDTIAIEPFQAGRRRHYTPEQKRSLLDETTRPGASVSRSRANTESLRACYFSGSESWTMHQEGLKANERVVPRAR